MYGGPVYVYHRSGSGYGGGTLFSPESTRAIAVDPETHIVFLSHFGGVTEHTADGSLLDTIAEGTFPQPGVAIDQDTKAVFVAGNQKIRVFEPIVTPDAIAEAPTDVTATSMTLTGHVDPAGGGEVTECHFEWGPQSGGFPNQEPCDPAPPLSVATEVTASISGLTSGARYHFRIVATNSSGTTTGSAFNFKLPGPPTISGQYSSGLTATGVDLHAEVNPQGGETTYHFEYGASTSYGQLGPDSGR